MLRALPAEPSSGASAIRIRLGDSLLADEDRTSLFSRRDRAMRLETSKGREFFVPLEFVRQDGLADLMRRLASVAAECKPAPSVPLRGVGEGARRDLEECRHALQDAIQREGNSVWTWFAVNHAAPHLLSERKVDRIVANPPWVTLRNIQESVCKRTMERMGKKLGLQADGKQAGNYVCIGVPRRRGGKLSSQPRTIGLTRKLILHPKSGNIMRGARTRPGEAFANDSLYWKIAKSEEEAGYLVSLLNASCLRRAFRKSKPSGRHFDQNPWRKAPIPRFDPKSENHVKLADLCTEAANVRRRFPGSGQVKVSRHIRARLADCGIMGRIDALARELLPDQAEA